MDLVGLADLHVTLAVLEGVRRHLRVRERVRGAHEARPRVAGQAPPRGGRIVRLCVGSVVVGIALVLSPQVEVHVHKRQEVGLSIRKGGRLRDHTAGSAS